MRRQHKSRFSIRGAIFIAIAAVTIASAGASVTRVSANIRNRESLVDCLYSRNMPSDFTSRRKLAESDPHVAMRESLPYRGTRKQNLHLRDDYCPEAKGSYSRGRQSRESYIANKSPRITWTQYFEILQGLKDTARAYGLDEEKFIQTAGCESKGFYPYALGDGGHARGLFQINDLYHKEVTPAQAFNWRWNAGWAARHMRIEGVMRVKRGGTKRFASIAGVWWTCYRSDDYLGYGYASIRANPGQTEVASILATN